MGSVISKWWFWLIAAVTVFFVAALIVGSTAQKDTVQYQAAPATTEQTQPAPAPAPAPAPQTTPAPQQQAPAQQSASNRQTSDFVDYLESRAPGTMNQVYSTIRRAHNQGIPDSVIEQTFKDSMKQSGITSGNLPPGVTLDSLFHEVESRALGRTS